MHTAILIVFILIITAGILYFIFRRDTKKREGLGDSIPHYVAYISWMAESAPDFQGFTSDHICDESTCESLNSMKNCGTLPCPTNPFNTPGLMIGIDTANCHCGSTDKCDNRSIQLCGLIQWAPIGSILPTGAQVFAARGNPTDRTYNIGGDFNIEQGSPDLASRLIAANILPPNGCNNEQLAMLLGNWKVSVSGQNFPQNDNGVDILLTITSSGSCTYNMTDRYGLGAGSLSINWIINSDGSKYMVFQWSNITAFIHAPTTMKCFSNISACSGSNGPQICSNGPPLIPLHWNPNVITWLFPGTPGTVTWTRSTISLSDQICN